MDDYYWHFFSEDTQHLDGMGTHPNVSNSKFFEFSVTKSSSFPVSARRWATTEKDNNTTHFPSNWAYKQGDLICPSQLKQGTIYIKILPFIWHWLSWGKINLQKLTTSLWYFFPLLEFPLAFINEIESIKFRPYRNPEWTDVLFEISLEQNILRFWMFLYFWHRPSKEVSVAILYNSLQLKKRVRL